MFNEIFEIASWMGGIAFALSGILLAARKHLDILGAVIWRCLLLLVVGFCGMWL